LPFIRDPDSVFCLFICVYLRLSADAFDFILIILSSLDRTIPVQALHILILTEEV